MTIMFSSRNHARTHLRQPQKHPLHHKPSIILYYHREDTHQSPDEYERRERLHDREPLYEQSDR
jgi:hypothetical protein